MSRASLGGTVTPQDSVCLLSFSFVLFLPVGRIKSKIILTWSATFSHTCLSMILVVIKSQTHLLQGWTLSSFKDVQENYARYLERISKFSFPHVLNNDHKNKSMCSLLNWQLWNEATVPMYKFLICLYKPITRHRVWLHF